jgi:hypothetical protein
MNRTLHYWLSVDEDKFKHSRVFSGRNYLLKHCMTFLPANPIACEVGVAEGFFSENILNILNPEKLFLIDLYQHSSSHNAYLPGNHFSYITEKFKNNIRVFIKKGLSWDMLNTLESDSLDYLYIDGDHSYASVQKDIQAAYRVVKSGGIIQLNDYTTFSPIENIRYGVVHAVNEFIQKYSPEVLGVSLDKDGYNDIAIRLLKP